MSRAPSAVPEPLSPLGWHPERPRLHPLRIVTAWLISAVALLLAAAAVPGAEVHGFAGAVVVAAIVAVLNAVLPPIVAALRLPFTVALGFLLVLVARRRDAPARGGYRPRASSTSTASPRRSRSP